MKDWHLCIGEGCAREGDFEELNCADAIDVADPEDPESLGEGQPGCILPPYCDDGMYEPCGEPEPEYEGSVEVEIEWPEIDSSDLIPQYPET
jgi:hypothetical protein